MGLAKSYTVKTVERVYQTMKKQDVFVCRDMRTANVKEVRFF